MDRQQRMENDLKILMNAAKEGHRLVTVGYDLNLNQAHYLMEMSLNGSEYTAIWSAYLAGFARGSRATRRGRIKIGRK